MALISCPECANQISNKALNCPHCGFPLELLNESEEKLDCPDFPNDLSIGKQITNWKGDAAFSGEFSKPQDFVADISSGKVTVMMFSNGISISRSLFSPPLNIHRSQIVSISHKSESEIQQVSKSVVGRAIVGGILTGGIGAIVGGMSGMGSKSKNVDVHYLIIHFWDAKTRIQQTAAISGPHRQIKAFADRFNQQR